MDIESFRTWCLQLPGTTEGIKWEEHLCFMVEEKIFIIMDIEPPHAFALKIDPNDFDALTLRNGIAQAAHMARKQWISIESLQLLAGKELKERVMESRALVISKLSKKLQAKYM